MDAAAVANSAGGTLPPPGMTPFSNAPTIRPTGQTKMPAATRRVPRPWERAARAARARASCSRRSTVSFPARRSSSALGSQPSSPTNPPMQPMIKKKMRADTDMATPLTQRAT
jgi:hypothetical protein